MWLVVAFQLTKERAVLARAGDDVNLGGLCALILQALCQAGLGKGILGQQLCKVHLDGILQNDVVLVCDQNVVNEPKCSALQTWHQGVCLFFEKISGFPNVFSYIFEGFRYISEDPHGLVSCPKAWVGCEQPAQNDQCKTFQCILVGEAQTGAVLAVWRTHQQLQVLSSYAWHST